MGDTGIKENQKKNKPRKNVCFLIVQQSKSNRNNLGSETPAP